MGTELKTVLHVLLWSPTMSPKPIRTMPWSDLMTCSTAACRVKYVPVVASVNSLPERSPSTNTVGILGVNFTVAIWQAASVTAATSPALVVSPPEPDMVTPPLPTMPPEEATPPVLTMPPLLATIPPVLVAPPLPVSPPEALVAPPAPPLAPPETPPLAAPIAPPQAPCAPPEPDALPESDALVQ